MNSRGSRNSSRKYNKNTAVLTLQTVDADQFLRYPSSMLSELVIENFILIEKLTIKPNNGFIALTGETGAGKSILIDALGLILGARGDPKYVRKNKQNATVTATFIIKHTHPVVKTLKENNIPIENLNHNTAKIQIRRIQNQNGKTKAFINQNPITRAFLRQCADMIVEIHGQYDGYKMNDHAHHRYILDKWETQNKTLKHIEIAWKNKINAQKELQNQTDKLKNIEKQKTDLENAIKDIETLNPMPKEEQKLAQERKILMQSEKINQTISEIKQSLEIYQNTPIHAALRNLEPLRETQNQNFLNLINSLENLNIATTEVQTATKDLTEMIDTSPEKLDHIQERLFLIRETARKYQTQPENLIQLKNTMKEKLKTLQNSSQTLKTLQNHADKTQSDYLHYAQKLTSLRRQNAPRLDQKINDELQFLKLADAQFKTYIETEEHLQSQYGADKVTFLVATNPGSPLMPVGYATSGGELSRLILAIKVCITQEGDAPILIFDEIDAAVGGETAHAIGKHMHKLSRNLQILAVTHSPQLAAIADEQVKITKAKNHNGEMCINAEKLKQKQRIEEIARMLSAEKITNEARAQAEKLLNIQKNETQI